MTDHKKFAEFDEMMIDGAEPPPKPPPMLFVWRVQLPDGSHGCITGKNANGQPFVLMSPSVDEALAMRQQAQHASNGIGHPVQLVTYVGGANAIVTLQPSQIVVPNVVPSKLMP